MAEGNTPTLTKEQQEAELATRLFKSVETMTESIPTIMERIGTIEANVDRFKDVDAGQVFERMEKIDAQVESVKRQIARGGGPNGIVVPGLEDYAKNFSVLRAIIGMKAGGSKDDFEKHGAGLEFEMMSQLREARAEAMSKGGQISSVAEDGAYFIGDQVIPDIIAAIYVRSQFIDLAGDGMTRVSVIDGLVGMPVTIPGFEGGCIAYWIGEEESYVESKANVKNITMQPRKLGVLTRITNEMRKFQAFGFEQWLRRDMIRALAKKMDWSVMYGPGTSNSPRGICFTNGVQVYRAETGASYASLGAARAASNWAGAELNFDGLDNMRGIIEDNDIEIDEPGSFATISAPRYFRRLRQLKIENYSSQTDGNPYLLGAPMIKDETMRSLIGEFGKTTQIANAVKPGASIGATAAGAATALYGDVVSGNLGEVVVGRWSGIELEDDGGTGLGFEKDQTNVKLRMYADVQVRQPKALVVCPDAQMRDS